MKLRRRIMNPGARAGVELVEANGGRVALVPLVPEKSTTALVERLREARSCATAG
jgi:bifunctional ADP-heptose synthase (sugar kinase/adenylyltransferase)